jgi:hypothetical protein
MVKVDGFPRPLYPPDAKQHGKTPSADGPDVVAYKRLVSRAGRWPWPDQGDPGFDDSFSNGFSHGKAGGNVGDSGVAGVQRQGKLDDTGWLGEKTFNLFRSIRIPDGLPHAGEPAMDSYSVELVNKAYALFKGHEPAPSPQGTVRAAALSKAITQLGIKESPAESNNQKYGQWYGMNGVPWCAIFVSWSFEQGSFDLGLDSPSFSAGRSYSYCPYIVSDARAGKNGLKTLDPDQVIPGDVVVYDWQWNGEYDHVGIFEKWTSGTSQFQAIEGNTSLSNDSNGGEVMRRSRSVSGQATCFVRVAEPS